MVCIYLRVFFREATLQEEGDLVALFVVLYPVQNNRRFLVAK
jgi:hypothetical protein